MIGLRSLVEDIITSSPVLENPSLAQLRDRSKAYSIPNDMGLLAFHSNVKARIPEATIDNIRVAGEEVQANLMKELKEIKEEVKKRGLIVVDRSVGTSQRFSLKVRAAVSKAYLHLALMFALNYFPSPEDAEPEILTLDIPNWPRKGIYVDPVERVNVILGSDYYGELKMSALRQAMNYARDEKGMLGVHAGSKQYLLDLDGEMRAKGFLIFGLSGTGKTTITMATHGLCPPERVILRQDDIVILDEGGYAAGTELNLYPKTDSVNSIPPLKEAIREAHTILENVAIKDGKVDFDDTSFCANGRAIVMREAIPIADGLVDLPRVDALILLTRRRDFPVACRLTSAEQGVAYFMLGESMKTAAEAGEVGEAVRIASFDPFIIEPKWKNGERLYSFLKANPKMRVYVLNTGYAGDIKIPPEATMASVLAIAKEEGEWSYDNALQLEVLGGVKGVRLEEYDPRRLLPDFNERMEKLREERRKHMIKHFPQLGFAIDAL